VIPLERTVRWSALLTGGGELLPTPKANAMVAAFPSSKVEISGEAARKIEAGPRSLLPSGRATATTNGGAGIARRRIGTIERAFAPRLGTVTCGEKTGRRAPGRNPTQSGVVVNEGPQQLTELLVGVGAPSLARWVRQQAGPKGIRKARIDPKDPVDLRDLSPSRPAFPK
jgi:hypothetical protein